jgi:IS30 family transposase
LIIRKGSESQIATLVERTSRLTMLVWIPYDRCADRVAKKAADTEHQYANIKARYKLSSDSIFSQLVNKLPANNDTREPAPAQS